MGYTHLLYDVDREAHIATVTLNKPERLNAIDQDDHRDILALIEEIQQDDDVWAVDGCPADCVIYAFENLYPDALPHVVLSGINDSQNVGDINGALALTSGTVGGAKTSACLGVPAMASSQGDGETIDFESGVAEVLAWVADQRAALLAGEVPLENIASINIPSCDTGAIRGSVDVPLATENPDEYNLLGLQDCESTLEDPQDDLEAFFNGYAATSPVPSNSSMTCDKLAN